MDRRAPALTLTLFFIGLAFSLSSAILSPLPTPGPTPIHPHHKQIMPKPHLHSPPPPLLEKLNLGKKLGLLFAAIAVALQVVFAAFLIYKRWQLSKLGRSGHFVAYVMANKNTSNIFGSILRKVLFSILLENQS
ncbi:hypothetical protein AXF42_Ash011712 [Apostasia shenzhenica]|uniref:Uncharacterized protein n=1 Tax=Apostasia shenzhenica TaxID=1088818 RepID=A0A2H9ZUS9_9ASPA|nr:hypothetical protein AXF42_Ash011712 [Apostasia shenzhenica]